MTDKGTDPTWCIGRFRFVLSEDLTLSGRSQSIYRVTASTTPMPASGARGVWAERLAQIRALRPPPGATDVVERSFQLQRDVPAVWYRVSRTFAQLRRIEAMRPLTDHVLLLARDTEAGKEPLAEKLVRNVADAYVVGHAHGFCVGHGAITGEPGENEQARAGFDHRTLPDFEVEIDTHTVREPSRKGPLSEIDAQRAQLAREGFKLKVLKNEARTVAGLKGREGITSLDQPGAATVIHCTWHFPGSAMRSDQPEILLEASARRADRKELLRVWERLLRSVQAVPMK